MKHSEKTEHTSKPVKNSIGDLQDSPRDRERLQPDEATLDLPDVKDIPGQEFIHPPSLGELADTTISSDDEEGVGLFDDDEADDTLIQMGTESDIPKEDKELLRQSDERMPTKDEDSLRRAAVDNTDNDGEPLNENSHARTGRDLDTGGVEADDANEQIGEEDEENNTYSLGGDEREADSNNGTAGIP
jgi:hypothetical protein